MCTFECKLKSAQKTSSTRLILKIGKAGITQTSRRSWKGCGRAGNGPNCGPQHLYTTTPRLDNVAVPLRNYQDAIASRRCSSSRPTWRAASNKLSLSPSVKTARFDEVTVYNSDGHMQNLREIAAQNTNDGDALTRFSNGSAPLGANYTNTLVSSNPRAVQLSVPKVACKFRIFLLCFP